MFPAMKGLVIKNTGSWYTVRTDDGQLVDCKIKGNFRLKGIRSTNPVAVGDWVQIVPNNEGTALITEIEDRHQSLQAESYHCGECGSGLSGDNSGQSPDLYNVYRSLFGFSRGISCAGGIDLQQNCHSG